MIHTKFLKEFKALQQRGRRIPIHIQEKVENETLSLIDQGHIIFLDICSDHQFISPIVITVKKDQSIKLAMDSKQINKSIHKNKYQMPNIEVLRDNIAHSAQEGTNKPGTTYFSTLDLRYAYSQLPLSVISVLFGVGLPEPTSSKQAFTDSPICPRSFRKPLI